MHRGASLVQPKYAGGDWIWNDARFCQFNHQQRTLTGRAHFNCFFNRGDPCAVTSLQERVLMQNKQSQVPDTNDFEQGCPRYITDMASRQRFREAAMEYLFSNMSHALVQETDAAAAEVFHFKEVPREQLISVHVR